MNRNLREEGKEAEGHALQALLNQGMELVHHNYHAPGGEIDLILKDADNLVFVEVRSTFVDSPLVSPEDSVGFTKQSRLRKAAGHFIESGAADNIDYQDTRFDVIGVRITDKEREITHIRDAFR